MPAKRFTIVVLLGLLALAPALGSESEPPTVLYRLAGQSFYLFGCIAGQCACPVAQVFLAGTFGLTPTGAAGELESYAVSDIEWFTHADGFFEHEITGSGTYLVGQGQQRLVAELSLDGDEPFTVDSGLVPTGAAFPRIDVEALTDTVCYQRGVALEAAPSDATIDLVLASRIDLVWSVAPAAGAYDVVGGELGVLRASGGDYTGATTDCLGAGLAAPALAHEVDPEPGQGLWFLVRGIPEPGYDSGGAGQVASRDAAIAESPHGCP